MLHLRDPGFLEIEEALRAICDVLVSSPSPLPGLCGVYGGQDEGALLPSAPSTLLLLTYEDAMGAGE